MQNRQNLCRQSRTFNDEPLIFIFLKVVIDLLYIKMSMPFFFLHEYSSGSETLDEGRVASLQGRGVKSQGGGVKFQDLEQSPRVVE